MRNASPVWTASSPIIVIAIVPVMGILILAVLIMTIVRVLLPMVVIVTTARMGEVPSSIGYRIAASVIVPISTMISIIAVSVAAIRSVVVAGLRIWRLAIGAMIVVVPRTSIVAAARLKWLVPRRRRHLYYHRTLIDALRNSGSLPGVYAENAVL